MNLLVIEKLTKDFADSRTTLSSLVADLNDKLERTRQHHLPAIKRAVAAAAAHHNSLQSAIDDHPELFIKPRTQIFHAIRVGIVKGKGKIEVDDHDRTITLIEKKLPDQLDTLAPSERTLVKSALKNLTVDQLKAIGCTITDAADHVLIQPVDDAVDKLVAALLKDATDEDGSRALACTNTRKEAA